MKKFSTGKIIAIWILSILLILSIALGIQWYHLLKDDTTKAYKADTTKIVSAKIIELHQSGYTVEYNGMQFNISCDISDIALSDTVHIKIDTQGTKSSFDDTLVCVFDN